MFFLLYLLGAFAWKFAYDFDLVWKRPNGFQAHFPSIKDIDFSQLATHEVDKFISDRTTLVSQYYLLCNQLEAKYSTHQEGSLGTLIFFVALPLLLAAKSAELFSSQILNWIVVLVAGVILWVIINVIYNKFFKIHPFEYDEDDYQSLLARIKDDDLLPGESRDTYANYMAVCQHYRYLTAVEENVRLRYSVGKFLTAAGVVFYILCVPQEL